MHFYLKMVGAVTFAMANAVSPVSIAAQDAAPPSLLAREKAATTDVLKVFDGIWVGTAEAVAPDGTTHRFEQMERIGPMLAGEIRVMEGKARDPKGKTLHNAFTVFSVTKDGIEMRSWTPGRAGSRIIELTKEGYNWRTSIGGSATMVYKIWIRDGVWNEIGELHRPDRAPAVAFRMTLRRLKDTDWPRANSDFAAEP